MDISPVINREFLLKVLEKEGKSKEDELVSFELAPGTKPGDNWASSIYNLNLELKSKEGLSKRRHLLIKCPPREKERVDVLLNSSNIFYKELMMYSEWIPALEMMQREILRLGSEDRIKLPYAPYVYGECVDFQNNKETLETSFLNNYIIMEDIRKQGFQMAARRKGLDIYHMRLAFKALAKVHSISWAYRTHVEKKLTEKFSCLVTNSKDFRDLWISVLKDNNLQNAIEVLEADGHVDLVNGIKRFQEWNLEMVADVYLGKVEEIQLGDLLRIPLDPKKYGRSADYQEIPWRVICHGDCWSNNMMFRYDSNDHPLDITLLDLQSPSEGCVVKDLQYAIYASTDAELRKDHLESLLQLYHDEFNENCLKLKVETLPDFSVQELRYRFERAKPLGLFMAMLGLPFMMIEENTAVDMEQMKGAVNPVFKKRLIELTQDMYNHGII